MKHLALAFVLVLAGASTASAQSRKAADRVHDFHTMDRQTPMTTFGVAVGFESWDHDPALSLGDAINAIVSVDVAGQYVSESGAGGYVTIPMAYVSSDDIGFPPFVVEGDSEVAIGNVEVGGLYAGRLGKNADMVFHAGAALPTADDDGVGGALGALAAGTRYSDLVDRIPNSTWLRAGFSPMGRASMFFWRADVGVDLMIDDGDGDAVDISPVFRIDVGAGVDIGQADFTAELVTNITNPENDAADETASTLAIGGRFAAGNTQPGVALILPVGFDDYDQFDFAFVASVTGRVP